MGNSSTTNLAAYSCFDGNLSMDSVTPEYWESSSINKSFEGGSIGTGFVILLFFIIGLPGNFILIVSMLYNRLYKDPTHILLLNLAISDLLVCLLVMPPTIISGFAGGYVFGESDYVRCQMCKTGLISLTLNIYSLNILGLISFDRFIFIKFCLYYNKIVTLRRTVIAVSVLWFICIAESILPLFGIGEIKYTYSLSTCLPYFIGETHVTKNIYYMISVLLVSLVPIGIIILTNIWIVCIVNKQIKKIYRQRMNVCEGNNLRDFDYNIKEEIRKEMNQKQLVLMRVFGIILLANTVTWTPIVIHTLLLTVYADRDFPLGQYIFVYLSLMLHSVLHPLIEGYFIPEIKATFRTIFTCNCKKVHLCSKDNTSRTNQNIILESRTEGTTKGCCAVSFDVCSAAFLTISTERPRLH